MTTELDPTATRANDPGWTPAAIKAAKAREKANAKAAKLERKDAKRADRKAAWSAFWGGLGRGVVAVWDFFMRNLLLAFCVAGVLGLGTFEWINGGNGWQDLYRGIWPPVIWAGAFGVVVLFYVAGTMALDEVEKPEAERKIVMIVGWASATVFAFCISVAGVFISSATNQVEAQNAAKASRLELANLRGEVATLKADLEIYNSEYWKLSEKQIQRAIDSRTRTAKSAVGLADLDPAGACAQPKLNFQQQRMCVRMNGGDDPTTGEAILGIRTELENVQREIKLALVKEEDLERLTGELKAFKVQAGDETAEAMAQMIEDQSGQKTLTMFYWILSSLLLLLSGWACHWAFGEIQRLTREARIRKGKVA